MSSLDNPPGWKRFVVSSGNRAPKQGLVRSRSFESRIFWWVRFEGCWEIGIWGRLWNSHKFLQSNFETDWEEWSDGDIEMGMSQKGKLKLEPKRNPFVFRIKVIGGRWHEIQVGWQFSDAAFNFQIVSDATFVRRDWIRWCVNIPNRDWLSLGVLLKVSLLRHLKPKIHIVADSRNSGRIITIIWLLEYGSYCGNYTSWKACWTIVTIPSVWKFKYLSTQVDRRHWMDDNTGDLRDGRGVGFRIIDLYFTVHQTWSWMSIDSFPFSRGSE
jgi:hypothetical protein